MGNREAELRAAEAECRTTGSRMAGHREQSTGTQEQNADHRSRVQGHRSRMPGSGNRIVGFGKRKARNFGVCALLLLVLLPGPPCGRGPTCWRAAGPDAGRGRLVELVLDEELDGLVFCHSEFVVEDCGVVVSLLCAEPEFSLV